MIIFSYVANIVRRQYCVRNMQSASASSAIELDVGRIRDLSKSGRHREALAAANVWRQPRPTTATSYT
jgi:hypothetical protein